MLAIGHLDGVRRALTDAGDVIVRAIPTDNLSARMVLQPVSKRLCASILTPDRVLWGYAFLPTVDQANSCLNHGSCGFFESWFPKIKTGAKLEPGLFLSHTL